VECLLECGAGSYDEANGKLTRLHINNGRIIEYPALVLVAGGLVPAFQMVCRTKADLPLPPVSWQVYLRLDKAPLMQGVYHYYNLDAQMATFRVTNYAQYCPDAYRDGYPVCIELWSDEADAGAAMQRAQNELRQAGVMTDAHALLASTAVQARNLHALCSLGVTHSMTRMREQLAQVMPSNMQVTGPYAQEGRLLLYDIWRDMVSGLDDVLR
jgi:hypothetical protein